MGRRQKFYSEPIPPHTRHCEALTNFEGVLVAPHDNLVVGRLTVLLLAIAQHLLRSSQKKMNQWVDKKTILSDFF